MNRRNSLEYNLSFAKKKKQKANTQRRVVHIGKNLRI